MENSSPWMDFKTQQPQAQPTAGNPWDDFKPKTDAQPEVGIGRTAFDQGMQGATFGLADEAQDALGSLGAKAFMAFKNNAPQMLGGEPGKFENESISDLYNEARQNSKQQLSNEVQQNPGTSIASNLAGALLTGGAGATTKAGTVIADSLRTGNLAARTAKGALAGAGSGALYGAGTADDGNRLQGAEQGALTGAVTGGALPVAGAALSDLGNTGLNIARGVVAKSPEAIQNMAESLKSNAGDLYTQMRQVGATFTPQASTDLLNNIKSAITSKQFIPELNPKTLAIVNHLDNQIAQAGTGGEISLGDLDQYRRLLGRIGNTEDGVSAGAVRKQIDDFVNGVAGKDLSNGSTDAIDLLNQGRKQYQQASKFEDISDILTKADGDPNKIKSGLTRFMNNDSNTRGWSDAEKEALKDAASSGGTEKLLKMGGKFGFDLGTSTTPGNTIAPIIGGALGTAAGGATGGIVAPVLGTAARIGQKLAARGGAQNLLDTLASDGGAVAKSAPISSLLSAPAQAPQKLQQGITPQLQAPAPAVTTQIQPLSYNIPEKTQVAENPVTEAPDISSFAKAESTNNPNAKNPESSASGLYQFTNKTWADMVSKYGAQTGINLRDKADPQAQAIMARLLAQDNIKSLQNSLGRMPTKGELYAAHVLGASGAAKLINADPNREAITLFPRQVFDGNHNIFFDGKSSKKPRTASQVYDLLVSKVS